MLFKHSRPHLFQLFRSSAINRSRQAFSLLEILIGVTILSVAIIPLSEMFSSTGRQLDQNKKYSYAHLIAHSVLEQLQTKAAVEPLSEMVSYKNYHGVFDGSEYPLSPHFQNFGNSIKGINPKEFPVLANELTSYRFKVIFQTVAGLEQDSRIREVIVEVLWNHSRRSQPSKLILKTIISNYEIV